MSINQLRLEFQDHKSLEKYTREYISTHFETTVNKDADVVPKLYNFGKISDLSYEKLLVVLSYYKNIVDTRKKPKARIAQIKDYYDSGKLNVHHTFDRGTDDNTDLIFWGIIFIIIILLIIFLVRRKN